MKNFKFEISNPSSPGAAAPRSTLDARPPSFNALHTSPSALRPSPVVRRPRNDARRALSAIFFLLLTALCFPPAARCSTPAAHSWEKQKSGTFAWLRGVFFVDAERGWAVGAKGALLSTADGGATWRVRRAPTEDALRDIFFTDEWTGWIVCERSVYMPRAKDEPRAYLLKTEDGGEKWSRVEVTGIDLEAVLARVAFADAAHGWAAGEFGALYATADGGRTWERQRVPTRHLLLGAHFHDAQAGWLVGAGTTLLHTSDGGATWRAGRIETAKKTATRARTVAPSSTTDSSPPSPQEFTPTSSPSPSPSSSAPSASPTSPRTSSPSIEASVRFNAVAFADARRGWAVGEGGAVYATDDGGATWRAQESGVAVDLFDVKFFDA